MKSIVDFLIRSYTPGQNITSERMMAIRVISSMPKKVQEKLKDTVINIGKIGASQYDYYHDILYIALGADETEVIHEIGHMVENKMIPSDKIAEIRKRIVGKVEFSDLESDIYYDNAGNPIEIYLLRSNFKS
mgnify:CR=1 FL=1